jgi:hypothetical protein
VAVAQHARAAHRRRAVRDIALGACLIAVPLLLTVEATARSGLSATALLPVTVVVVVGAVLSVAQRSWGDSRSQVGLRARLHGLLLAVVCLLALATVVLVAVGGATHRAELALFLAATVTAWLVVLWDGYRARLQARSVSSDGPPRDSAPAVASETEQRLGRLADGNVVVYNEWRSAELPFAGTGPRVYSHQLVANVRRGRVDKDGERCTPSRIALEELYDHLQREVSRTFPCGIRLYAYGKTLRKGSSLLQGTYGPPVDSLPDPDIRARIIADGSADGRVHFWAQSVSESGDIVVSLLVSPHLRRDVLELPLKIHVLLPLNPIIEEIIDLPERRSALVADAVMDGTLGFADAVVDTLGRRGGLLFDRMSVGFTRLRIRARVWRGQSFDFGADLALREIVAVDSPHHDFEVDEIRQEALDLLTRVFSAAKGFLEERDVDVAFWEKETGTVINNVQTWTVGKVNADIVGFGNHNTVFQQKSTSKPDAKEEEKT